MKDVATTQQNILRRKQDRVLRWARREQMLKRLQEYGIPLTQVAETGPSAGVVYIDTPDGQLTLRLASWYWTCGEANGKGWTSLYKKVKPR